MRPPASVTFTKLSQYNLLTLCYVMMKKKKSEIVKRKNRDYYLLKKICRSVFTNPDVISVQRCCVSSDTYMHIRCLCLDLQKSEMVNFHITAGDFENANFVFIGQ